MDEKQITYALVRETARVADAAEEQVRFLRASTNIQCPACMQPPERLGEVAISGAQAMIERQLEYFAASVDRGQTDLQNREHREHLARDLVREALSYWPQHPKTWHSQYYPASMDRCPRCGARNPILAPALDEIKAAYAPLPPGFGTVGSCCSCERELEPGKRCPDHPESGIAFVPARPA